MVKIEQIMEQYMNKSDLVAEIEKLTPPFYPTLAEKMSYQDAIKDCIDIIYTLKVKEVDFNKEIDLVEDKYYGFESLSRADIIDVAKHFFEFGMSVSNKAQKGV